MVEGPLTPFWWVWPEILFPVFLRPTPVGIDAMYLPGIVVLVVVIVAGWS
jgi:hypothetical protein